MLDNFLVIHRSYTAAEVDIVPFQRRHVCEERVFVGWAEEIRYCWPLPIKNRFSLLLTHDVQKWVRSYLQYWSHGVNECSTIRVTPGGVSAVVPGRIPTEKITLVVGSLSERADSIIRLNPEYKRRWNNLRTMADLNHWAFWDRFRCVLRVKLPTWLISSKSISILYGDKT